MRAISCLGTSSSLFSLMCVLTSVAPLRAADDTRTVNVVCSRGDSIQAALQKHPNKKLIVEIRGICREDVLVRRDYVTLRGSDPTVDGIQGVETVNQVAFSTLKVYASIEFTMENLLVTGGVRNGVGIIGTSPAFVKNCRFLDNGNFGFTLASSTVIATGVTVTGLRGIGIFDAGVFTCSGCSVTADDIAFGNFGGAQATISNSDFIGRIAISSSAAASETEVKDSTVEGMIISELNSLLILDGVSQTSNSDQNYVLVDATLKSLGMTSLMGPTTVEEFSKVLLRDGSMHDGDLTCSSASDAFCDDPADVNGTVTGCASCVQSLATRAQAGEGSPRSSASTRPSARTVRP